MDQQNDMKGFDNGKRLSPEMPILTPETAMRDAGIKKFSNPFSNKKQE